MRMVHIIAADARYACDQIQSAIDGVLKAILVCTHGVEPLANFVLFAYEFGSSPTFTGLFRLLQDLHVGSRARNGFYFDHVALETIGKSIFDRSKGVYVLIIVLRSVPSIACWQRVIL